ncbi:hypothetical protein [Phaeospirillum tilakii]|uniref:Phage tail tube protein, GTA-gp10 n=1 Tax=Phaeospirillum tilakii TaxID=741673 RepID=A0ABW5CC27_9PROT
MSIATETGTITLAGTEYQIRAFSLDELQEVLPLITAYYQAVATQGHAAAISVATQVLAKALRRDDVGALPATVDDVWAAIDRIGGVAGLRQLGERLTALVPPNATGTGSTPTSSSSGPETGSPSAA